MQKAKISQDVLDQKKKVGVFDQLDTWPYHKAIIIKVIVLCQSRQINKCNSKKSSEKDVHIQENLFISETALQRNGKRVLFQHMM